MSEDPNSPGGARVHFSLLLQISLAAMAAFGTLLLGMGQRDLSLPLLALVFSATSVYFTDIRRDFVLAPTHANLIAIVAVGWALFNFFEGGTESQLLAIANLLFYLQTILLYQEKTPRVYWQLIVLSLLQVVVSAALNEGVVFGVLLTLYMAIAFAALLMFFAHREGLRMASRSRRSRRADSPSSPAFAASSNSGSGGCSFLCTADELTAPWFRQRFLSQIGGFSAVTLVLTVVLFFASPRSDRGDWQGSSDAFNSETGLPAEVTLNELGRVLQSDELVMRVNFREAASGAAYKIHTDPYFRARVLTVYSNDQGRGRWKARRGSRHARPLASPPPTGELVIQDIVCEENEGSLAAVFPVFAPGATPDDVIYDHVHAVAHRIQTVESSPRQFRISLTTNAFRGGGQSALIPVESFENGLDEGFAAISDELDRMREFDRDLFPGLEKLAADAIRERNAEGESTSVKAQILQDHFRLPGRYAYSLNFEEVNERRNRNLDPIEDFAVNHKTGHCEYFASALTLMLRSQGIPARMVIGYHGGDYNSVGSYYLVRKKDTHAWVECYLPASEIPPGVLAEGERAPYGAWLRLEPTPAGDDPIEQSFTVSIASRFAEMGDYLQILWNEYVIRLNSERQQNSFFQPLTAAVRNAAKAFFDPSAWERFLRGPFDGDWSSWFARGFNWRGGAAAMLACLLLAAAVRGIAAAWRSWQVRRTARVAEGERVVPRVPFYERFEAILAKAGMHRSAPQTQREFAGMVADLFRLTPGKEGAAAYPERVVDLFYAVRFGHAPLDPAEAARIDEALNLLEAALESPPG